MSQITLNQDENLNPIGYPPLVNFSYDNLSSIAEGTARYSNQTLDDNFLHSIISIAVPILFGAIFVLGFAGNFLVIFVILRNKMMSTTNILILNLAVADLLFITFCVPSTASDYLSMRRWLFGDVWCKTVYYLIYVTAYISIYTLVLMSVDRCLAVTYPVSSKSFRTIVNTRNSILLTWFFILFLCLPVCFVYGEVSYEFQLEKRVTCKFVESDKTLLAVQMTFFVTSYFFPLFLICALYMRILWRLWFSGSNRKSLKKSVVKKKKLTKMVTAIILAFAICWFPIQIIMVLKSLKVYTTDTPSKVSLQIAANCLAYTNSCINPFLYAFLSSNFRSSFKNFFVCRSNNKLNSTTGDSKTKTTNVL